MMEAPGWYREKKRSQGEVREFVKSYGAVDAIWVDEEEFERILKAFARPVGRVRSLKVEGVLIKALEVLHAQEG